MGKKSLIIAALVSSALSACHDDVTAPGTEAEVGVIRSTTSFGMCLGYCRSTLEITAQRTAYRLFDDRTGLPPLSVETTTSDADWRALMSAVERDALQRLGAVIGCPDCADGGAETVEAVGVDWSHAVAFEYGAEVPTLKALLNRVRQIRERHDRQLRPL